MMQSSSTSFSVPSSISSLCCIFTVLLLVFLEFACPASIGDINDASSKDSVQTLSSSHVVVAVTLTVVALILLIVIVPGCMDCMNAEVSSDPVGDNSAPRWGGASAYTPCSGNDLGAGFRTGEVVDINNRQNQQLPYSMVPTQIPEQSGFVGYQQGGSAGAVGYTGYNASIGSAGDGGGPRNYNPMEREEAPPPYSEATHGTR